MKARTHKTRLLLIEDDPSITELIRYNVEAEGYRLETSGNGEDGLMLAEETVPDLVLLDWMLPNLSGIEICRRLRASPKTRGIPIIMLTARGEEADKIRGLDTGADDYITKPFSPRELISRIRAVLRRLRPALAGEVLKFSDIELDPATYKVSRGGDKLELSPTEFRLLLHFLENPGRVFSRGQLLDAVWGRGIYVDERTVDVHIRRLRKALNAGGGEDLIRTVRSAGYSLDDEG